jgi:hypothetical protein
MSETTSSLRTDLEVLRRFSRRARRNENTTNMLLVGDDAFHSRPLMLITTTILARSGPIPADADACFGGVWPVCGNNEAAGLRERFT